MSKEIHVLHNQFSWNSLTILSNIKQSNNRIFYLTILSSNNPRRESFGKQCGKRRKWWYLAFFFLTTKFCTLTSTPHNFLSKLLAAFTVNNYQSNDQRRQSHAKLIHLQTTRETCHIMAFNAPMHVFPCFLTPARTQLSFKVTDYFLHMHEVNILKLLNLLCNATKSVKIA